MHEIRKNPETKPGSLIIVTLGMLFFFPKNTVGIYLESLDFTSALNVCVSAQSEFHRCVFMKSIFQYGMSVVYLYK